MKLQYFTIPLTALLSVIFMSFQVMAETPGLSKELSEKLSIAVATGDATTVRELIDNPAVDLNYYRARLTILGWAIWNQRSEFRELLLAKDSVDVNHESVAYALARKGSLESINSLVAHKNFDPLPQHYKVAVEYQADSFVKQVIGHKKFEVNSVHEGRSRRKWSPLLLAAHYDHQVAAEELLAKEDIKVNQVIQGNTALLEAAKRFKTSKVGVALLGHKDIDINLYDDDSFRNGPALYHAVNYANTDLVQALVLREDLKTLNYENKGHSANTMTAAMGNAVYGYWSGRFRPDHEDLFKEKATILEALLTRDDLEINKITALGRTPLSVYSSHHSLIEILIKDSRTDVNLMSKTSDYHRSGLMFRATLSDRESVKLLVNHKDIDVELQSGDGNTALHFASDPEVVKLLLPHVKDVNHRNKVNMSAAAIAALRNNHRVLALLLETGEVDLSKETSKLDLLEAMIRDGYTVQTFKKIIHLEGVDVNRVSNEGIFTPLHVAAGMGRVEHLKALLEHPDININYKNKNGEKALDFALVHGNEAVVKLILAKEGAESTPTHTNPDLKFISAAYLGNLKLVSELLDSGKVDVNYLNQKNQSAFSYAIMRNHRQVALRILEEEKLDINKELGGRWSKMNVLHLVAESGDLVLLQAILNNPKVDVNKESAGGATALMLAIRSQRHSVIDFLLTYEGISVAPTSGHSSPLLEAIRAKDLKTVQALLKFPESNPGMVDIGEVRETPLQLAVRSGRVDILELLLKEDSVDINDKRGGYSVLSTAISYRHNKVFLFLVAQPDLDVNYAGNGFWAQTPIVELIDAIYRYRDEVKRKEWLEMFEALVKHENIDVDLRIGRDKFTPLMKILTELRVINDDLGAHLVGLILDVSVKSLHLEDSRGRTPAGVLEQIKKVRPKTYAVIKSYL